MKQRDSLSADVYITVAGHQRDSPSADVYITVAGHQRDSLPADVYITVAGHQRDSLPADVCITVAGHRIQPSSCVCNVGVQFDSNLKMEHQIVNTVKSCYYQIRNIGRIRPHLTEESCKTLVLALVTSRLDYGNALLHGLPQRALQRLQNVQNCVARLITRTRKYEHITPVLQRSHWLPIHLRPKCFCLPTVH